MTNPAGSGMEKSQEDEAALGNGRQIPRDPLVDRGALPPEPSGDAGPEDVHPEEVKKKYQRLRQTFKAGNSDNAPEVRQFLQEFTQVRSGLERHLQEAILQFACFWFDYIGEFPLEIPARRHEEAVVVPVERPPIKVGTMLKDYHDELQWIYSPGSIRGLEKTPTKWDDFWQDIRKFRDPQLRDLLPPEVAERMRKRLATLLSKGALSASERAEAGDLLGQMGDPRPGTGIRLVPSRNDAEEPVPDILWVEIPAGEFQMGADADGEMAQDSEAPAHCLELPAFYISRYPITNAQYRPFVEGGGYDEPRYWTEEGWAWRQGEQYPDSEDVFRDRILRRMRQQWQNNRPREQRDQPFFFEHPFLGISNRPVVGISWFEAMAYCRWLAETLGFDVKHPGSVTPEHRENISVWRAREIVSERPRQQRSTDILSRYETGLTQLLNRIGPKHARRSEALFMQQRLIEHLKLYRRPDGTHLREEEWNRILDRLNELARDTLNVSFDDLCGQPALRWQIDLPSEAQWEKTASWNETGRSKNKRKWPWSSKWHADRANSEEAGIRSTCAVGSFPKGMSPYGCLDMAGNVWEWTRSKWGRERYPPSSRYPYQAGDGRESPMGADLRVIRGGSWLNIQEYTRSSHRFWRLPERFDSFLGFRVVLHQVPEVIDRPEGPAVIYEPWPAEEPLPPAPGTELPQEPPGEEPPPKIAPTTANKIRDLLRQDQLDEALALLATLKGYQDQASRLVKRLGIIRWQQQRSTMSPAEAKAERDIIARIILIFISR